MSERVNFFAETGNKTIVLSPNVRIKQGMNNMAVEVIREYELDTYPFIKMPADWKKESGKEEIAHRTTAVSPAVQVTEEPKELKTVAEEVSAPTQDEDAVPQVDDAVERGKAMQAKVRENMWTAGRILAMDFPRAKKAVAEQDDVKKLLELWQGAQSKPQLAKVVKARILELDPDNTFIKRDANEK